MFDSGSQAFSDLERRRGEVERHKENTARLAFFFQRLRTTGQGTVEFEDRIDFGMTFIEEPFMAYGSYVDLDDLGTLLDVSEGETPPMPLCSGSVTQWDQDDRDFYVGAWVSVVVSFPTISNIEVTVPVDLQPVVEHHFSFSAIAIKDVNPELVD